MAKFYGSLHGSRGEVTRCGTSSSGIESHIRGWGQGIKVHVGYSPGGNQLVATIHVTGGSNNRHSISSISLNESDLIAMRDGEVKLELVPVMRDHYESTQELIDEWSVKNPLLNAASECALDNASEFGADPWIVVQRKPLKKF